MLLIWVIYTLALVRLARGTIGPLAPSHAKYSWLSVAIIFVLAWGAQGSHLSPSLLPDNEALDRHQLISHLVARILPVAAFGLLIISEFCTYIFSLFAPEVIFAYLHQPTMAVHAASLTYYVIELFQSYHAMTDAFGRPSFPLRYVLWTVSVSTMLVCIY